MTSLRVFAVACVGIGIAIVTWAFLRGSREEVSDEWRRDQLYDKSGY